jgi:hypothetical protein
MLIPAWGSGTLLVAAHAKTPYPRRTTVRTSWGQCPMPMLPTNTKTTARNRVQNPLSASGPWVATIHAHCTISAIERIDHASREKTTHLDTLVQQYKSVNNSQIDVGTRLVPAYYKLLTATCQVAATRKNAPPRVIPFISNCWYPTTKCSSMQRAPHQAYDIPQRHVPRRLLVQGRRPAADNKGTGSSSSSSSSSSRSWLPRVHWRLAAPAWTLYFIFAPYFCQSLVIQQQQWAVVNSRISATKGRRDIVLFSVCATEV